MTLPTPYYDKDGITIFCADCREVLPFIETVDLVLTDPPYGIGYDRAANSNSGKRSRNGASYKSVHDITGWDDKPPARWLIEQAIEKGKNAIVWGGNYFDLPPSRCWLFWDKQNDGKTFADGEMSWTNLGGSVRRLVHLWDGMLQQNMRNKDARWHPTQKPVAVMRWAIAMAPETIQTILDPFMGSGTTLVAAQREGKRAIGIELEEKYCRIAANRLRQGVLDFGE